MIGHSAIIARLLFPAILGLAAPAGAQTPQPPPDFADSLAGGPDFWEVAGLSVGSALNLRADPSTADPVLARLPAGTVLRNHGCRMLDGQRWCEVSQDDPALRGWVAGSYVREAVGEGLPSVETPAEAGASAR